MVAIDVSLLHEATCYATELQYHTVNFLSFVYISVLVNWTASKTGQTSLHYKFVLDFR